jgi:hypothetical protein
VCFFRAPDVAPDLTGAWVVRARELGSAVTLEMDAVRCCGLRLFGTVVFTGVSALAGVDDGRAGVPPQLKGRTGVARQQSRPGQTVLDFSHYTGPGDVEAATFTITHGKVDVTLRVNPEQSARAWIGFYPLPRDMKPPVT